MWMSCDCHVTVVCVCQESKGKLVECCKAWALVTQARLKVKQLIHQYRVAKAKLDSAEVSQPHLLTPPLSNLSSPTSSLLFFIFLCYVKNNINCVLSYHSCVQW